MIWSVLWTDDRPEAQVHRAEPRGYVIASHMRDVLCGIGIVAAIGMGLAVLVLTGGAG